MKYLTDLGDCTDLGPTVVVEDATLVPHIVTPHGTHDDVIRPHTGYWLLKTFPGTQAEQNMREIELKRHDGDLINFLMYSPLEAACPEPAKEIFSTKTTKALHLQLEELKMIK